MSFTTHPEQKAWISKRNSFAAAPFTRLIQKVCLDGLTLGPDQWTVDTFGPVDLHLIFESAHSYSTLIRGSPIRLALRQAGHRRRLQIRYLRRPRLFQSGGNDAVGGTDYGLLAGHEDAGLRNRDRSYRRLLLEATATRARHQKPHLGMLRTSLQSAGHRIREASGTRIFLRTNRNQRDEICRMPLLSPGSDC